jgi:hypothetical protein
MPNRILREGINDSEKINALSEAAELFYRKLMSLVDDFGRFEANTRVLCGKLYALRTDRTPGDIEFFLKECSSGEDPLITLYTVGKKRYLQINNFGQRERVAKYPSPTEGVETLAAKCRNVRQESASRARSTPNTNTNTPSKERGLGETAGDDYEPTSDESQEFDSWAQAAYARHPKKSKKFLAEQSLMRRFCRDPAARERFDRNHELWCETQAWREKSGAFCPPLHEFVADDAWEYPPTQPSQQSQGRGTMQDLFG